MGIGVRGTGQTARNRGEMPSCRSPRVRGDQRILPHVGRCSGSGTGSPDRRDLDVDQRYLVKTERTLLKMSGRKLISTDMSLG